MDVESTYKELWFTDDEEVEIGFENYEGEVHVHMDWLTDWRGDPETRTHAVLTVEEAKKMAIELLAFCERIQNGYDP